MNEKLAIFNVCRFDTIFSKITETVTEALTLPAAETLRRQLEHESRYTQSYSLYAPDLNMIQVQHPWTGHAVDVATGFYKIGRAIIGNCHNLEEGDNRVRVTFSPSVHCNPESIAKGKTIVSASGGPCPDLSLGNMTRKSNTFQKLWCFCDIDFHQRCGVNYNIQVPLWEYNEK